MSEHAAQFHAFYRELRIAGQLDFYETRRQEYAQAHHETIVLRNVLLLLSALAGLAGQLLDGGARSWAGVASAVFGSLVGAVTAFESLMGFPKLSKIYADAELNLREAEIDWDSTTPGDDLTAEVDRVEGIFQSENGQWGQLVVENAAAPGVDPSMIDGSL